jgi:hypothetical protein
MAVRPEAIEHWGEDDFDIDDYLVDEAERVSELVVVARALLREADPHGLAEFNRLYHEGWAHRPAYWSGELLEAFRDALGRIPDPADEGVGFWALADETVTELAPKLPWTSRFVGSPVGQLRESIKAEWWNAHQLHGFVAKAVADGNAVIAD